MKKGLDKVNILGLMIDRIDMKTAIIRLNDFLNMDKTSCVFTPNSEIAMKAYKDDNYMKVLNSADLLTPDGIGIVYASKILKKPIAERVSGFDLVSAFFKQAKDLKVFIFGGSQEAGLKAKGNIEKEFKGVKIVGIRDGYSGEEGLIDEINQSACDILLVCLGAPKQENWIYNNRDKLKAKLAIGAGGSVDVFAGVVKRAPDAFIKLNLEWFYRLICQPKRFFRMMSLPHFAIIVLLKGKRYKKGDIKCH